ncbi:MAG: phosphatase PAP2 family protein [Spirochaetia bacterium]|nr:phosphatase PAP2 family protein [Spirochaetia bacterium]
MPTSETLPKPVRVLPTDLIVFAEAAFLSALCFAHPHAGPFSVMGVSLSAAWMAGVLDAALAILALAMPVLVKPDAHPVLRFLRTFYPQLLSALFFFQVIFLSSLVFGGYSHDAFFESIDQAVFGFQPAREFSAAFSHNAWLNELMFTAYCSYFVLLAVTPWIPWFMGRKDEAERQLFVFVALSAILDIWYVFFRVQGPKYWMPDLRELWYGHFQGGPITHFFQNGVDTVTLSGAAFPSSHMAEMTMFCILAARSHKKLAAFYVPWTVIIGAATIYLYAHYAVDSVAGVVVGLALTYALLALSGRASALAGSVASLYGRLRLWLARRPGIAKAPPA